MNIFYVLLLGLAVSIDAFVAGIAYGLKSIKMPVRSLIVIGLITGICTGVAMALAYYLGSLLNTHLAVAAGSLMLITIGTWNILQEYIAKNSSNKDTKVANARLTVRMGRIVISIMADPETADMHHSHSISPSEAVLLGLALGIDNIVATFAAALIKPLPLYTPVIMAIIQILLIGLGMTAATRLGSDDLKKDFPIFPEQY